MRHPPHRVWAVIALTLCSAGSPPQAGQASQGAPEEALLAIFDQVEWGIPLQEIKRRFPDQEFIRLQPFAGLERASVGTGYWTRIAGEQVFVGFHFLKSGALVRVDCSIQPGTPVASRAIFERYQALFTDRHGAPEIQTSQDIHVAVWRPRFTIFMVGLTADQLTVGIQGWDRHYFQDTLARFE